MKRQWSEAELDTHWALTAQEEALRLAGLGLTKASIAKKLSLGEATVYRILARENVKKQSKSQN